MSERIYYTKPSITELEVEYATDATKMLFDVVNNMTQYADVLGLSVNPTGNV